jgi:hypothetical protein
MLVGWSRWDADGQRRAAQLHACSRAIRREKEAKVRSVPQWNHQTPSERSERSEPSDHRPLLSDQRCSPHPNCLDAPDWPELSRLIVPKGHLPNLKQKSDLGINLDLTSICIPLVFEICLAWLWHMAPLTCTVHSSILPCLESLKIQTKL